MNIIDNQDSFGNTYLSISDILESIDILVDDKSTFKRWISENSSSVFPQQPDQVIYHSYMVLEKDIENNQMVVIYIYIYVNLYLTLI